MALVFGLFVFLSAALVFFVLARTHRYFYYLAFLATIQTFDFVLYLLPQAAFFTAIFQTVLFGSFYLYGPLFFGFILGLMNVANNGKSLIVRHLVIALVLAFTASGVYLFTQLNSSSVFSMGWLDFIAVPVPIGIFTSYQIWLLTRFKKAQWPMHAIRLAVFGLALLSGITVILHLLLLSGWLSNIWRLIIPASFALAMYMFFVYVAFKFGDFKRFVTLRERKPVLTAEERQRISRQVNDYLIEGENFKNNELKLVNVATALDVNERHLSEAINLENGLSFQNLVNQYRLDYVTEQLSDNFNGNLLELALEAGFGSKTAFNRSFKSRFNLTPGQWLAENRASDT